MTSLNILNEYPVPLGLQDDETSQHQAQGENDPADDPG
jgi:hypothetical protein